MRHSEREERARRYTGGVLLSLLLAGCAHISAETRSYSASAIPSTAPVAVTFTYEAGRIEQATSSQRGIEMRTVRAGQETRFLALRDDIAFKLRDAGVVVAPEAQAVYLVQMVPTIRETDCARTCNVIETLSFVVVRSDTRDQPIARVRLENGGGGKAKTKDSDFAKRAASELLSILRAGR